MLTSVQVRDNFILNSQKPPLILIDPFLLCVFINKLVQSLTFLQILLQYENKKGSTLMKEMHNMQVAETIIHNSKKKIKWNIWIYQFSYEFYPRLKSRVSSKFYCAKDATWVDYESGLCRSVPFLINRIVTHVAVSADHFLVKIMGIQFGISCEMQHVTILV